MIMSQISTDQAVLSIDECWDLLKSQEFGRLAYVSNGELAITPLNYAVDGDQLVFRTADGSKLRALVGNSGVAFEIDHIDGELAASVLVRGSAELLSADDEGRLEQAGLRAWLGDQRPVLVAIRPTSVTGRRYALRRPWKRMRR
jgi:uncharacterized protein